VIEHPNINQCESLLEASRDELIRLARLEYSRGMVVREDDGRRIVAQRAPDDLTWIDPRALRMPSL
jgi:hypothetical protein